MSVLLAPETPGAAASYSPHTLQRTVVLPELRVLFLPVPKAACTTLLWLLADLAGLSAQQFADSSSAEVSPALTVHDTNLWPSDYRFASYSEQDREQLLSEPGWLRFSLVRNPATRLWSAWLSKLLLREPRFVDQYGAEPWFPRVPENGEEIVADFRRFVRAVGEQRASDVHWAVQADLVEQLPLNHVGRVEQIADTLALLRRHVGSERWPRERRDHNRSRIGLPEHAYDPAAAAALRRHFELDFTAFGYDDALPGPGFVPREAWLEQVEGQLEAMRATVEERARLGELHRLASRSQRRLEDAERRGARDRAGRLGHPRSPAISNIEGHADFSVRWGWADGPLETGFTAVLRVKNEARSLPFTLPPLLRAVSRVVLVDNASTDGTAAVAHMVANAEGLGDRLTVVSYPFAVARCGAEHLAAPAASVHSLVYFYNWSFSHVRTGYALKWDGDMVMTNATVAILRGLAWQLEAADVVIKVPRRPLYVIDDRRAFIDLDLCNCEPWGWPNRPGYSFAKAIDWELPLWGGEAETLQLPDWGCVELKYLGADEFGHWSHVNFENSSRQERKRRELEVFHALSAGDEARVAGIEAIHAPPGRHVVDYVRREWLPLRALGLTPSAQTGRQRVAAVAEAAA